MNNPAENTERKLILPPAAMVELLFRLKGGTFIDDKDFDLTSLLAEMEFPTGTEAKSAKIESAKAGNVIVSRSVVTLTDETADACRILVTHRDQHVITTGPSVLTSGDPRSTPAEVLSKKITVSKPPEAYDKIGLALSSAGKTGGVHYLFEVFRARISRDAQITAIKEHASLVPLAEARAAIADKPTEASVMERILKA